MHRLIRLVMDGIDMGVLHCLSEDIKYFLDQTNKNNVSLSRADIDDEKYPGNLEPVCKYYIATDHFYINRLYMIKTLKEIFKKYGIELGEVDDG